MAVLALAAGCGAIRDDHQLPKGPIHGLGVLEAFGKIGIEHDAAPPPLEAALVSADIPPGRC